MQRLALALGALGLLSSACGDTRRIVGGDVVRQQVCDALVPASCSYRARCGAFDGTEDECAASEADCCVGADCSRLVETSAGALELCASSIAEAACLPEGPVLSASCERLAGELAGAPPRDAGVGPGDAAMGGDAGHLDAGVDAATPALVPLYGFCDTDDQCAGGACVTVVASGAQRICTMRCTGTEDRTTCPGGHCIRVGVVEGETYLGDQPHCLQACESDAACPVLEPGGLGVAGADLVCRTTLVSGLDVCAP